MILCRKSKTENPSVQQLHDLGKELGLKKLYILNEGNSPSGSQKDRAARLHIEDARAQGIAEITAATCGNYGIALAFHALSASLACRVFLPKESSDEFRVELTWMGAVVEIVDGTYEEAVDLSRAYAQISGAYDCNAGGNNRSIQIRAYECMAYDIFRQVGNLESLACPVSNGTTLAGISSGFKRARLQGLISSTPRLIAASARSFQSPVVKSFETQEKKCLTLSKNFLKGTEINDPLINWYSCDGDAALQAVYESKGFAFGISDAELLWMKNRLQCVEGINAQPAATAGLVALVRAYWEGFISARAPILAVVTARERQEPGIKVSEKLVIKKSESNVFKTMRVSDALEVKL